MSVRKDSDHAEAIKVTQSVVELYVSAFDKHDAKAISMLFVPEGVFLPPNGAPMVQGRDAIERSWAELFKSLGGGHETITVKDAIPVGNDAIVAIDDFQIVGIDPDKVVMSGRAGFTLAKTPEGWRYVSLTVQITPPIANK